MTTTTQHLHTVIQHWADLQEALGTPNTTTWPPAGLRAYLNRLDQLDAEEVEAERWRALALRTLERDPAQIGARPVPIRLAIHETMRVVQAALIECADQVAAIIQRPVMGLLPDGYPEADHHRRELLIRQDRNDPRRWSWTGTRPDAPHAALWLIGRMQGAPGPFRPLPDTEARLIATVASGAANRVETALDMTRQARTITRPCPICAGHLQIHGGNGDVPVAHCTDCGRTWTNTRETAA